MSDTATEQLYVALESFHKTMEQLCAKESGTLVAKSLADQFNNLLDMAKGICKDNPIVQSVQTVKEKYVRFSDLLMSSRLLRDQVGHIIESENVDATIKATII